MYPFTSQDPFVKAAAKTQQTSMFTKLEEARDQGATGIIEYNGTFSTVKKLRLSEPEFAVFETVSGLYIKHAGPYTFYAISHKA